MPTPPEDPLVAPCFTNVDLPRLRRHFVATMVMVTNTGLPRERSSG